jgi:uncharacterized protein
LSAHDFIAGIGVGLVGGFTSGLLGVSPGGGLVVFSVLLLGAEQHIAQGISLIAQIPPTSLSGIGRYRQNGSRAPIRWLVLLAVGMLVGGVAGALAAGNVSSSALRWTYVFYLTASGALLIFKRSDREREGGSGGGAEQFPRVALLAVGLIAGFFSGFLGIGGGLAISVGLSVWLRTPQRQAQLMSLILAMIPTTVPAAWAYWRQGWSISWLVVTGVILGLWCGTDLGARIANVVSSSTLRSVLISFVFTMAVYMACKALS